jgi:hypothetical protein
MTIFDLVFILVFLTSAVTLIRILYLGLRRRQDKAWRLTKYLGLSLGIYLGLVLIVSLAMPQRTLKVGDQECYDDWCMAVEQVERRNAPPGVAYAVTLRLSSRARRVAQRENGVAFYLVDADGQRYDPAPDQSAPPLNVLLQPQQSVTTPRVFIVPVDAQVRGLAVAHEGGFQIGWFIIGSGPFRKPTLVRLDALNVSG